MRGSGISAEKQVVTLSFSLSVCREGKESSEAKEFEKKQPQNFKGPGERRQSSAARGLRRFMVKKIKNLAGWGGTVCLERTPGGTMKRRNQLSIPMGWRLFGSEERK